MALQEPALLNLIQVTKKIADAEKRKKNDCPPFGGFPWEDNDEYDMMENH